MKRLFILLIGFLVIGGVVTSCTKEYKAKKLIEEEFKKNAKDPSSITVEILSCDSSFQSYIDSPYGLKHFENVSNLRSEYCNKLSAFEFDECTWEAVANADSAYKRAERSFDSARIAYKGPFKGWRMTANVRGKNSFGAIVLQQYDVYFSIDVDSIKYYYKAH